MASFNMIHHIKQRKVEYVIYNYWQTNTYYATIEFSSLGYCQPTSIANHPYLNFIKFSNPGCSYGDAAYHPKLLRG